MGERRKIVRRVRRNTPAKGRYVIWTPAMAQDLSDLWPHNTGKAISAYLSRAYRRTVSESSVLGKGRYMKLGRKSKTVGRPRTRAAKPRKVARRAARRG